MAQPPLSQRMQRLERELGVRLFDRSSRQVTITRSGALLLEEARALLDRSEEFLACATRIKDGQSGLLRAALPSGLARETVAAILADLHQHHPSVELELEELSTTDQLARLASHDLEVGLIHHPCDVAGLELGPVLRCELGVLLPRASLLAARDEVPLASLTGLGLVLFPRADAPAVYDDLLTTCARNGYTPDSLRHGQGDSFVHGLILSVNAVAFSPPDRGTAAGSPSSEVVWRPLAGAPLAWRYSVAWPHGRKDTAIHAFADAVPRALWNTAAVSTDPPPRPLHLRPASEYWL